MANLKHLAILRKALRAENIEIWNRWRSEDFLTVPNLADLDLGRANLEGANLLSADLHKTYLRNANLYGANLREANLKWASLQDADLLWANLTDANLNKANLTGANLQGANLTDVSLQDADLKDSVVYRTIFSDVDLSATINLDKVQHRGPSYLDILTLYKSQGKIPEIFLRGCGVSNAMITLARSLVGTPIDFHSCFISYTHDDKDFATRLHDRLQSEGIRCWLDEKQIFPSVDIYDGMDRSIRYWDKVLLCCSEHSLTSWWVDNEIEIIFKKEHEFNVLALIPLDLDGYLFGADFTSIKKDKLHSRLAANFKGWKHDNDTFEREIEKVIRALRTDGGRGEPPESKL